jgi:hypothetical protein
MRAFHDALPCTSPLHSTPDRSPSGDLPPALTLQEEHRANPSRISAFQLEKPQHSSTTTT